MENTEATYMIEAGSKVRTVYGEDATLVVDWFNWEATVTVETASGRVERYHPAKVFQSGSPLPYQP